MSISRSTGWLFLCAIAVFLCAIVSSADAQPRKQGKLEIPRYSGADRNFRSLDHLDPEDVGKPLYSSMVNDTTVLGSWSFDPLTAEGWITVDRTEQVGTFFHVDDFAGLGGGDFGRLNPLEGNQSMWCGARPAPCDPVCSYIALPGYGNFWDQFFSTATCVNVTGDVTVDYRIAWDVEPFYDFATLQYDVCDDNWINLEGGWQVWDDIGSGTYSSVIPAASHSGQIRLRFRFESDFTYSDEDALWDTDGAVILDSLTVSDGGGVVLGTETFESEAVGALVTASGNWAASVTPGYGDFAALFPGHALEQGPLSACNSNPSSVWGFFSGSTYNYACGGFPEQAVVPYVNERDQYIWNEIWSPWVTLSGSGESVELAFDAYIDLPLNPVVFYIWHVRSRTTPGGSPGPWRDRNFLYPTLPSKAWYRHVEQITDMIDDGAVEVQVALGVVDMCEQFCGVYGDGTCHTHAPLLDNIEVRTVDTDGPQWSVRDIDLFQDTFATDGTLTGTARIDAALDVADSWSQTLRPGDSTAVTVDDPEFGIATDSYTGTGPAAYAYVSVWNGTDPYSGTAITDDASRWPVVDSLLHDGRTWYCVRMDTVYGFQGPQEDEYCIDLNDNLFVPGDTICFFFGATSGPPNGQTTYWSPYTGTTLSMSEALDDPDECTILPASGSLGAGGDGILYVDCYDGLGAEPFFDTAFQLNGLTVDRYDVRAPRSQAGNHPGGRVTNVSQQLLPAYRAVIWNSGDIRSGSLGDGINEKGNDGAMLLAFADGLQSPGGIFFSGNDLPEFWAFSLFGDYQTLRDTYIDFNLATDDHYTSAPLSPLVTGEAGGPYDNIPSGPDTTYAFGFCPEYADFDVMYSYVSDRWLIYEGWESSAAALGQTTMNPNNVPVTVALWGFSYHTIRDDRPTPEIDRVVMLRQTLNEMGLNLPVPTAARAPANNLLAQNVPNPFNPVTSIEFSVKERAPVTLRIYNVRGQRVKTLVNDTRAPGITHRIQWDGRNDAGQQVASGVYFYRLVTRGFVKTRKMVLLK